MNRSQSICKILQEPLGALEKIIASGKMLCRETQKITHIYTWSGFFFRSMKWKFIYVIQFKNTSKQELDATNSLGNEGSLPSACYLSLLHIYTERESRAFISFPSDKMRKTGKVCQPKLELTCTDLFLWQSRGMISSHVRPKSFSQSSHSRHHQCFP